MELMDIFSKLKSHLSLFTLLLQKHGPQCKLLCTKGTPGYRCSIQNKPILGTNSSLSLEGDSGRVKGHLLNCGH